MKTNQLRNYPNHSPINVLDYIPTSLHASIKDGTNTTDLSSYIQSAIDDANALSGRAKVLLNGFKYKTTTELFIKTDVVLCDGTISFIPTTNDIAAINIGTQDGDYLVRVGGVENIVVDASTATTTGIMGFNFGHWARACFINNCRAVMNNGTPATADRGHIGFSFYGVRADLATSAGAYQNTIFECSAYNCRIAYRLDTDGYGVGGFAPEMNANKIISCAAYSCLKSAVYVGEGAQDNNIQVRADTFSNQLTLGTTVKILELRGSYNTIEIEEEIGSIADTQYTVSIEGDNARYNDVYYKTQQVVTSRINDVVTGSAVGKNTCRFTGRLQPDGGDLFVVSGIEAVGAGSNATYDSVILPGPCVLIKAIGRATSIPASYTRLYFCKSGIIDTTQRLTWDSGSSAGEVKTKDNDPTGSGTINSKFIYDTNDLMDIIIDQDSSGGQTVRYAIYFRMLRDL